MTKDRRSKPAVCELPPTISHNLPSETHMVLLCGFHHTNSYHPNQLYIDRLSCWDMYPLESTQCLARSFYIIVFLQIDLHNLFTVTFAGIGYGDTQSQFLTGLYIIRTKHHSTIAERGIAQSMTEGKAVPGSCNGKSGRSYYNPQNQEAVTHYGRR